jgi:hypothetical protein
MTTICLSLALMLASPLADTLATVDAPQVILHDPSPGLISEVPAGQWSVETSLTFPMVRIYMVKGAYRPSDGVELGFGGAFQNWKNVDEAPLGQSHAWTLLLSCRRYLWRGLHAEIEFWPAYNQFKSYLDDQTYRGFELWVEYKLGYAVALTPRVRLLVQPGIGHALWMQTRWPDLEYESFADLVSQSVIFVPQVMVSRRF